MNSNSPIIMAAILTKFTKLIISLAIGVGRLSKLEANPAILPITVLSPTAITTPLAVPKSKQLNLSNPITIVVFVIDY